MMPFPPSIWSTDRWICNTEEQLEAALREYRDAEEEAEGHGQDGEDRDAFRDRVGRIYSQNREIDRGMRRIRGEHPQEWHLLKGFYLWELWKDQARGWHHTAVAMGWEMPQCQLFQRCRVGADTRYERESCWTGARCPALLEKFWEVHARSLRVLLLGLQRR